MRPPLRLSKEPYSPRSPETSVLRCSQNELLFSSNLFQKPGLDSCLHINCTPDSGPGLLNGPDPNLCSDNHRNPRPPSSISCVSSLAEACISPRWSLPAPRSSQGADVCGRKPRPCHPHGIRNTEPEGQTVRTGLTKGAWAGVSRVSMASLRLSPGRVVNFPYVHK